MLKNKYNFLTYGSQLFFKQKITMLSMKLTPNTPSMISLFVYLDL